ncbi:hypothetical protein [Microscilla marina]|uniref:hypothetical protein n=1 Tax=Microscilla marina TaxID=1027 RepID=UPI0018DC8062|nr:hypothetical protein [Microscilla marina]
MQRDMLLMERNSRFCHFVDTIKSASFQNKYSKTAFETKDLGVEEIIVDYKDSIVCIHRGTIALPRKSSFMEKHWRVDSEGKFVLDKTVKIREMAPNRRE